jgi:hypothetical protein
MSRLEPGPLNQKQPGFTPAVVSATRRRGAVAVTVDSMEMLTQS